MHVLIPTWKQIYRIMWNPFKKKDPQPIEPKSREEFVRRLKEISKVPIGHEESLGAMCYCPAPQPPFGNEDKDEVDDSLPWGCWLIIIAIVIIIVSFLIYLELC